MVLFRNDALDLETDERLIGFVQPAILAALAGPQANEGPNRPVSCRLAFACQEKAGFSLEDGDQMVRHDVHLVLMPLFGGELAFIAFFGEFRDASLGFAIGPQREEFFRRLHVQ
jgi:hypothetical protein